MPHRAHPLSPPGRLPRDRRVSFEPLFEDCEGAGLRLAVNGTALAHFAVERLNGQMEAHREVDERYLEWLERCPHAIRSFENIENKMKGKRVAVFLDYDGTLTPIVRNPDEAVMSEEMRRIVHCVAYLFPTAIISGRGRDKVHGFVKLDELYYAGSHGLDIKAPSSKHRAHDLPDVTAYQPAAAFEPLINRVYSQFQEAVKCIKGAHVEHNKFCLSVHFRNCEKDSVESLQKIVKEIVCQYDAELKTTTGRKVLEVRPRLEWDKGRAVEHLLKSLKLDQDDVIPIYLGDDKTDEDAFRFLKKRGNGIGILVSTKTKPTDASFSLYDPHEVLHFLQKLICWAEKGRISRTNLKILHER